MFLTFSFFTPYHHFSCVQLNWKCEWVWRASVSLKCCCLSRLCGRTHLPGFELLPAFNIVEAGKQIVKVAGVVSLKWNIELRVICVRVVGGVCLNDLIEREHIHWEMQWVLDGAFMIKMALTTENDTYLWYTSSCGISVRFWWEVSGGGAVIRVCSQIQVEQILTAWDERGQRENSPVIYCNMKGTISLLTIRTKTQLLCWHQQSLTLGQFAVIVFGLCGCLTAGIHPAFHKAVHPTARLWWSRPRMQRFHQHAREDETKEAVY